MIWVVKVMLKEDEKDKVKKRKEREEQGEDTSNEDGAFLVWPEIEVEASEKWEALVIAVTKLGLANYVPMTKFWKSSSIKKKDPRKVRVHRTNTGPSLEV